MLNMTLYMFALQFAPVVGDLAAEKQKNLDILDKLSSKKPALDVKKATNAYIASEQRLVLNPSVMSARDPVHVCTINYM